MSAAAAQAPCNLGVQMTCWLELGAEGDSEDRSQDSWTGGKLAPSVPARRACPVVMDGFTLFPAPPGWGRGSVPGSWEKSGLFLHFTFLLVLQTGVNSDVAPFCLEASPLLGVLLLPALLFVFFTR